MDINSKNYALYAMKPTIETEDRRRRSKQVVPNYKEVICFIESLKIASGIRSLPPALLIGAGIKYVLLGADYHAYPAEKANQNG